MPTFFAGDIATPGIRAWRFTFDEANYWLMTAMRGALADMALAGNWIQEGDCDPDAAADLAEQISLSLEPTLDLIGLVFPFAGDVANIPEGSLLCDGSSYLRTDFPDLFATIGTTYGAIDGTHFNVPRIGGRTIVGTGSSAGTSTYTLAQVVGEETHQLVTAEIPSHTHADLGHAHSVPLFVLTGTAVIPPLDSGFNAPIVTSSSGTASANNQNTGGDGAHENRQPSIALNYIISAVH